MEELIIQILSILKNIKKGLMNGCSFIKRIFLSNNDNLEDIEYWHLRVKNIGRRSVLNASHGEKEYESVTTMQKTILFPLLKELLIGNEKTILDLGCGPGRFSDELSNIINEKCIAIDPIEDLLKMAQFSERVEYKQMIEGIIPLNDNTVDVVWICLVLGGITNKKILHNTIAEIDRVLKPGGLVFLTENTCDKLSGTHWKFRSVKTYKKLFPFINLKILSSYIDNGENISIMAGRKL